MARTMVSRGCRLHDPTRRRRARPTRSMLDARRRAGVADQRRRRRRETATDRHAVEQDPYGRPDQLPDVADDAEGEAEASGKPEGGECDDLAALLSANLRGHDEEEPVDGDREHFDRERHHGRHRMEQEAADPVGLEGSPCVGQGEQERGQRDPFGMTPDEADEPDSDDASPCGRRATAPSVQAPGHEHHRREPDAGPGERPAGRGEPDPFLRDEDEPGGDEERLRQGLSRLGGDDRYRTGFAAARVTQQHRPCDFSADGRGRGQVVDRVTGHPESDQLAERDAPGGLRREREAPRAAVERVRDDLLAQHERHTPSDMEQRYLHRVQVDSPQQHDQAKRPERRQDLRATRHRARVARAQLHRLSQ